MRLYYILSFIFSEAKDTQNLDGTSNSMENISESSDVETGCSREETI